jgi:hypothetical protein
VFWSSIFAYVFPYPAVPDVGTAKPASVRGFCPFVSRDLTNLYMIFKVAVSTVGVINVNWRGILMNAVG